MITNHFNKSRQGRIYVFFSVIVFIASTLFLTEGCAKSDYEKALTGEDIASDAQANDKVSDSITLDIQSSENTGADSGSGATSGVTEKSTTGGAKTII